jgi:hypothetical protein
MREQPLFWQVGIVVEDIEQAMDEFTRALGAEWTEVQDRMSGRVTFSRQGPPYLELIEGKPGGLWDASAGSRIDHLGFWAQDLDEERRRLEQEGAPVIFNGQSMEAPFNYHLLSATNVRLEAIDARAKDILRKNWEFGAL